MDYLNKITKTCEVDTVYKICIPRKVCILDETKDRVAVLPLLCGKTSKMGWFIHKILNHKLYTLSMTTNSRSVNSGVRNAKL